MRVEPLAEHREEVLVEGEYPDAAAHAPPDERGRLPVADDREVGERPEHGQTRFLEGPHHHGVAALTLRLDHHPAHRRDLDELSRDLPRERRRGVPVPVQGRVDSVELEQRPVARDRPGVSSIDL